MEKNKLKLSIFLTQPGAEATTQEKGFKIEALVDTTADVSIFSNAVIEKVYGGNSSFPYSFRPIRDVTGSLYKAKSSFITVGVETTSGALVQSQLECLIIDDFGDAVIGSDFLTQLGMQVTLDYKNQKVTVQSYNWESFEEEVASQYRALGANVKQNINLSGFQIDLLVEETTPSKQQLRLVVECKYYKERVGNRLVNEFARVLDTLKREGLADKGVIVSSAGFTQDASLVAKTSGLELLTIDDLRQTLSGRGVVATYTKTPISNKPIPAQKVKAKNPKIFVVMPFTQELEDVYHFGIREVVAKLGGSCERADELQYVGGIIEKIYDSIKNADIIISEMTAPNPNVYYEVGFAHALGKTVILITSEIKTSPFDLRNYNHIIYSNIKDLSQRLEKMLSQLM